MSNAQAREGADHDLDGSLDIISIWYTIQGEGPFAGSPAVFVRLAGCNLQCPGCDTNYTKGRRRMSPEEIVEAIKAADKSAENRNHDHGLSPPLVVLTGGEPLRQNIAPLVDLLLQSDPRWDLPGTPPAQFEVQIETNGTYPLPLSIQEKIDAWQADLTIVCSPKTKVNKDLIPYIDAFKYILKAGEVNSINGLPIKSLDCNSPVAYPPPGWVGEIYLQPYDEGDPIKNRENLDACVASCMQFGYILCLQLHKIIGMD